MGNVPWIEIQMTRQQEKNTERKKCRSRRRAEVERETDEARWKSRIERKTEKRWRRDKRKILSMDDSTKRIHTDRFVVDEKPKPIRNLLSVWREATNGNDEEKRTHSMFSQCVCVCSLCTFMCATSDVCMDCAHSFLFLLQILDFGRRRSVHYICLFFLFFFFFSVIGVIVIVLLAVLVVYSGDKGKRSDSDEKKNVNDIIIRISSDSSSNSGDSNRGSIGSDGVRQRQTTHGQIIHISK